MEISSDFRMMFGAADPAELRMVTEIAQVEQEVAKCRQTKLLSV